MSGKAKNSGIAVKNLFGTGLNPDAVNKARETTPADAEIARLQAQLETKNTQLENALVPQDDGSWLLFGQVRLTKTALETPASFTESDKDLLGEIVVGMYEKSGFWMGDWVNSYLNDNMDDNVRGEVYASLAKKFDVERKTLNQYASVCRILGASNRLETLSFTHHMYAAFLPEPLKGEEYTFLLDASKNKWSVRDLQSAIKTAVEKLAPMPDVVVEVVIDTKPMKKEFGDATKVFHSDVSSWSSKKRNEYRGKVAILRRLLDDIESKLDE